MIKRNSIRPDLNRYTTHYFGIAAAAAIGAAGSIAGSLIQSGAAGEASDQQSAALAAAIARIEASLDPSIKELMRAQGVSEVELRKYLRQSLRQLRPYQAAGAGALQRRAQLLGLADPTQGPRPTAPVRPDLESIPAGPERRAARRSYQQALAKFQNDNAAWDQRQAAYGSDPSYGEFTRAYDDTYEPQIAEAAGRRYEDKYAPEILDVSRMKFGAGDFEADPGYQFRRSEGTRGIEQSAAAGGRLMSGATLKGLDRFNQDLASNEFDRAHGRWADVRNTRLGALTGQQRFDYGVFGDQRNTELDSLYNRRNFDYGDFTGRRNYLTDALSSIAGEGQNAVNASNQARQYFGGQLSANRINTAGQAGNWRIQVANAIAALLGEQGAAQAAGTIGQADALTSGIQGVANAAGNYFGYYGYNRPRTGTPHYTY